MERIRTAIRDKIGVNSKFYKLGSTTLDFFYTVKCEGITTWNTIKQIENEKRSNYARNIYLKNLEFPIKARPGTRDVSTIVNNVIRKEYGRYSPFNEPRWLIDAGAYIGDTTAYFLSKYRNLKAVALEPNPENYEMAQLNLAPYGERATILKKGLFSNEIKRKFKGEGTGGCIANSGIEIECISIPSLLEQYAIQYLDILKMDIEGAEENIFSASSRNWLDRVGLLIIEIHGSRIEKKIFKVLKDKKFMMKKYRSIWYCRPIKR